MVASRASIEPDPQSMTAEMSASMEAYAASGDWERVEEIVVKLRAVIMEVPEEERRHAVQVARRSIEKVQTLAQDARHDITGKLSAIRRGKDATAAYAAAD